MATQTVEFYGLPGQTILSKLFAPGSDTQVASVTATEQTNRKGLYRAVYTNIAAGLYRLMAFVGTTPIATWWVDLTLDTATFQSYEMPISIQVAGVYNADPDAPWIDGSFGDRFLISNSNQRTVAVTGAHHIAADIHELQPAVINNTHFATDAIDANALAASAVDEIIAAMPFPIEICPEAFLNTNMDLELLSKNVFVYFNEETRTHTITLKDGTFDGQPMRFILNDNDQVTVFSQSNIVSTTNTALVTITPINILPEECGHWSLRRMSDGFVYVNGPARQRVAAAYHPPTP